MPSTIRKSIKVLNSIMITMVMGLGLSILMPRILGVEDIAVFYTVESLALLSFTILHMGLTSYIVKNVRGSIEEAREITNPILVFILFFGIFLFSVMIAVLNIMEYETKVIQLSALMSVFVVLLNVQKSVLYPLLYNLDFSEFAARLTIVAKFFQLAMVSLSLFLSGDLYVVIGAFCVAQSIPVLFSLHKLHGIGVLKGVVSYKKIASMVTVSVPFLLVTVVNEVNASVDIAMLSRFANPFEVAQYGTARKLSTASTMLIPIFGNVIVPTLAKLQHQDMGAYTNLFLRSVRLVIVFCIALSLGFGLFSVDVIQLLYGDDFKVSAWILVALSMSVTTTYLNTLISSSVALMTNGKMMSYFSVGATILNIILNYVFISFAAPLLGPGGAGIAVCLATFTTEMINIVSLGLLVRHKVFSRSVCLGLFVSTALSITMILGFSWIGSQSLLDRIGAFCIFLPALILFTRLATISEVMQVKDKVMTRLGRG